jgi:polysaccharide deacetylase family protein (PEP-CTERM system associated)
VILEAVAAQAPPVLNAFTVDVEDWFHICGVAGPLAREHWDALPSRVVTTTRWLLDELDRSRIRATFFVLGWIAERHPALISEIRAAGHEIGSHGHLHRRVYELDRESFTADLRSSVRALGMAGVNAARCFRAPEWSINDRSLWALEVLASEGFGIDASMAPVRLVGNVTYPRYPHVRETNAGRILECPPLVADRFGQSIPMGWGWGFRMSSTRRVLRTIDGANRAGRAAVLIVHPWELDPDPPRVKLPPRLWFAHYFRLEGFRDRLRAVLRDASFGPLGSLEAGYGTQS